MLACEFEFCVRGPIAPSTGFLHGVGIVCVWQSSHANERMKIGAELEKVQADNKELRALLAGRGVMAPPPQLTTNDATGVTLEEAPAPPPISHVDRPLGA